MLLVSEFTDFKLVCFYFFIIILGKINVCACYNDSYCINSIVVETLIASYSRILEYT